MHGSGHNAGPGPSPVGGGGGTSLFTPSDSLILNEGLPDNARASMYSNRPRRLSGSSNASSSYDTTSNSNSTPRESFESRMRSSSWGSQTSFESFYSAHSSQQHRASFFGQGQFPWQAPPKPVRRKSKPGELFSMLPGEVVDLIFAHLKKLHTAPGSTSCATCWMRDACSAALCSRKMLRHARGALYEDVQLVGADSALHRKKYKMVAGTRIILLRKTLRGNPNLAMMVKTLKVPAMPETVGNQAEYLDLVASLVMACPNLERVAGFYPRFDHSFARYFHALSTRQRLKEMNWVVEAAQYRPQHKPRASSGGSTLTKMMQPSKSSQTQLQALAQRQAQASTGEALHPQQVASFLELHSNWQFLTTLSVHCQPGSTMMPPTLIVKSLAYLPGLQNLHLSHLPCTAFNDDSLLSLPPLKKLTLVHLSGLTSAGLSAFASRASTGSTKLEALTIVHCRLDCLKVLARILASLTFLTSFSLVQSHPPALPEGEVIWLFPYLASTTLKHLHWDIPASATRGTMTDSILTQSIEAGGFPALRRLRAPNDPEGWFQKLCRPQEKADLPGDRYRGGVQHHLSSHSRTNSYTGRQTPPARGSGDAKTPEFSNLHQARLAAQARIEGSRRMPRFFVNVVDEDGLLVEKYGIAAFVGSVTSRIAYHLVPDPGAADERGGLVGMKDLLGDGGESLGAKDADESAKREGCAGRWNAFAGGVGDKKDTKDRWVHTERGRWRGVTLG